jgi:hypothetical protein
MKYVFSIFFLIIAFVSFMTAVTEKDKHVKINFGMLCAFCCALSPVVYKLL